MASVTLQDLLEAGTHFGHQTKRWNPKMKRYILCARNGIYIVDLNKTIQCLDAFLSRVRAEVGKGGKVLIVGTKEQIKDSVREEASRCGMPYVTDRWLGGMLTNFKTIRQSVARLEKIEAMEKDGSVEALTKKERQTLMKRKEKLEQVLTGIRNLRKLPSLVFVVDVIKEHIAVAEARRLRLPIGATVDTNCDPDSVDFPIPGNDDAIKSVVLIARAVADTIVDAGGSVRLEEIESAGDKSATGAEGDAGGQVEEEEGEEGDGESSGRKRRVVRRRIVSQGSAA